MNKLLFITYFWPPASKATIHWPLKIIKYLPRYNWQSSVLTVEEESFEARDFSLSKDIAPDLEVITSKVWEPFSLYRKFLGNDSNKPLVAGEVMSLTNRGFKQRLTQWIRSNIFIPDARIGWYPFAVKRGMKFLESNPVDRIITIGPPHSTHLIGYSLSKKTGIPHVPVLIDPWSDIVYYKSLTRSGIAKDLDTFYEKCVLRRAAEVIFVTNSTREDYIGKYFFIQDKSHVLYWGFNEDDFTGVNKNRSCKDEMIILHSGNIFDYQNPKNFWKTITDLKNSGKKIRLRFTGTVSPMIKQEIEKNDLSEITDYLGVLPYKDMLQEVMNADVLLVCPSEKRHIPGKLFEYLRSGNRILAFNDDNPEVKQMIESANAGMMLSYNDSGKIFFDKFDSFAPNTDYVRKYDRKLIAEKFAEILDSIPWLNHK